MKLNLKSNITPRLQTSFGARKFPKMFTGKESLSHFYLSTEPKIINLVLPGFDLSLFSNTSRRWVDEQLGIVHMKIIFDILKFCKYLTKGKAKGRTVKDKEQSPEAPQSLI